MYYLEHHYNGCTFPYFFCSLLSYLFSFPCRTPSSICLLSSHSASKFLTLLPGHPYPLRSQCCRSQDSHGCFMSSAGLKAVQVGAPRLITPLTGSTLSWKIPYWRDRWPVEQHSPGTHGHLATKSSSRHLRQHRHHQHFSWERTNAWILRNEAEQPSYNDRTNPAMTEQIHYSQSCWPLSASSSFKKNSSQTIKSAISTKILEASITFYTTSPAPSPEMTPITNSTSTDVGEDISLTHRHIHTQYCKFNQKH